MSSKLGQIRIRTTKFAVIERLENPDRLIWEKCYSYYRLIMGEISPRASGWFNHVVEAKRFEGVFLYRKVRLIKKSNSYKNPLVQKSSFMQRNTPGVTRITNSFKMGYPIPQHLI